MDQLLLWIANGTIQSPSEDVTIMMQHLMEMIRQSKPQTLATLLNKCSLEMNNPENNCAPTKL
jgi:hypothetical protein